MADNENDETSDDEGGIGGALRDMAGVFGLGGVVDSAAEALDELVDGDADHDGLSNRSNSNPQSAGSLDGALLMAATLRSIGPIRPNTMAPG